MQTQTEGQRFIRLPEVRNLTGLGRSQIYAMMLAGKFPPKIKLGERSCAWVEGDVRRWIAERVAAARAAA
jgi:prophage regulatory protein